MAITVNTGFHLGAALPLDDRAYLTKAEMLTVDENIYTDYFLTVCADDGFIYIFDKSVDELDPETGKFRLFAGNVEEAIKILNADEETENSVRYWIKTLASDATYDNEEKTVWTIEGYDTQYSQADIADVIVGNPLTLDDDHQLIYNDENLDAPVFEIETISSGDKVVTIPQSQTITSDTTIKEAIDNVEEFSKIDIEIAEETTEGYLKTYILSQGKKEIGKIDIPKDLVITEGKTLKIENVINSDSEEIVGYKIKGTDITYTEEDTKNEESLYYGYPTVEGVFICLTVANQKAPIIIDAKDLVDTGSLGNVTEDITANVEVGGIEIGDVIKEGTDITALVKQLLVKYFAPTITLSVSESLIQRVGTVLTNLVLTAKVVKKSEPVTKIIIDNEEITEDVSVGGNFTKTIASVDSSTTFTATVTDDKKTSTASLTIDFVLPYMYGVLGKNSIDNDADLANLTQVVEKKGVKTFGYSASNQYCVFVMPAEYADLSSILDPSSFENLKSWTKSTYTNEAGESYKVYFTNTPVTTTGVFKYTFK